MPDDEITIGAVATDGGDRSTLPSFEARKLPTPPKVPPRAVRVNAWETVGDMMPINPKGPGYLGTGCGLPAGGDGHSGTICDGFGRYTPTRTGVSSAWIARATGRGACGTISGAMMTSERAST